MRTTAREDRLLVVSDVHMGNRLHSTRRAFAEFVQFALDSHYSICINGDGIDIAHMSLSHLVSELTPSLRLFGKLFENDLRIYYTVGNHDIALEHFLNDIGQIRVVPFLSVASGDQRIRIEHGHMYDDMFLRFPRLYYIFTLVGRYALMIGPKVYLAMHKFNDWFVDFSEWGLSGFGLFGKKKTRFDSDIPGEREVFRLGAEASGIRGFDAVVFGHTHAEGQRVLLDGIQYYNTGSWFANPHAVAIDQGRLWFGSVADLVQHGDPFPISQDEVVRSITGAYPVQHLNADRLHLANGGKTGAR